MFCYCCSWGLWFTFSTFLVKKLDDVLGKIFSIVNHGGRQTWFFDNVIWYDGWIGKSRFILPRHSFMYGTNCSDLQESIFLAEDLEDWHVKIKRANTKIDDFISSVIIWKSEFITAGFLVPSVFPLWKKNIWFLSQALLFYDDFLDFSLLF